MRSHLLCAAALLFGAAAAPADEKAEPARIRALVRQLDDEEFAVREKAERALRSAGKGAVPLLKKELARKHSLEVRKRLRRVVVHLVGYDEDRARALIPQLGADSYDERNYATAMLTHMGKPILPLLRTELAKRPGDLEVRYRLGKVIRDIEGKP